MIVRNKPHTYIADYEATLIMDENGDTVPVIIRLPGKRKAYEYVAKNYGTHIITHAEARAAIIRTYRHLMYARYGHNDYRTLDTYVRKATTGRLYDDYRKVLERETL